MSKAIRVTQQNNQPPPSRLASSPQHWSRLRGSSGIRGLLRRQVNINPTLHPSNPSPQLEQSYIHDVDTGLTGILKAHFSGLRPPQIWLGYNYLSQHWLGFVNESITASPQGITWPFSNSKTACGQQHKILHQQKQMLALSQLYL